MNANLLVSFLMLGSYANAQVTDFGMTSEAHKDNVGKIVFSKNPILFQKENPSEFTTSFKFPEDKIFFMAYFPMSIANRCHQEHGVLPGIANARIIFTFYVNGEDVGSSIQEINMDMLNKWTGWSEVKTPLGTDNGMLPKYTQIFKDNVLPKLKKGNNTVRMVVGYKVMADNKEYENKNPLTEGTMTINQEADFAKKLDAAPKALYSDAQLEKKIFDVLTFRWRKTTIIKRVILTEKEWRVERNPPTVPKNS